MKMHEPSTIDQVEARIDKLQKSYVSLQEQFKKTQNDFERHLGDSALRVIDILDMIETATLNIDLNSEVSSDVQLVIKKITRRLIDLLRFWQVEEIILKDGKVEVGKTKVLETRVVSNEILSGTVLEVCRKGYQRGSKIIRPVSVITAV